MLLACQVFAVSFDFSNVDSSWSFYGEGQGALVKDQGMGDKGSLWMSTDWGKAKRHFMNLKI